MSGVPVRTWTIDTWLRVATETGRTYNSVEVSSGPKTNGTVEVVAVEDVRRVLDAEYAQSELLVARATLVRVRRALGLEGGAGTC